MAIVAGKVFAQEQPGTIRSENIIYGSASGTDLTLDLFEPSHKNGAAIFYIVSSGFFSDRTKIIPARYTPFLERGYTVFAVVHGSRPSFFISDAQEHIHRAVRFVRHNASRWKVDPRRFGVVGTSSGGFLSLTIGTQGGFGPATAKDAIDREDSSVQAVACFFPPTDYLNWSRPREDAVAFGATHGFIPPIGPEGISRERQLAIEKEISPINFVTNRTAPTLIIHGDSDELVPLYQSQLFELKCREAGVKIHLIVKAGKGHSYSGWERDLNVCADWFDEHLSQNSKIESAQMPLTSGK